MSGNLDILRQKKVLLIASNPTVSTVTNWNIGFWWAELVHPFWELTESGYEVEIASPDGGKLEGDSWSDPRDASSYSAHDILSLGFINTPNLMEMVNNSKKLSEVNQADYEAIFLVGGQAPMFTFYNDERVHKFVAEFYEAGKVTAIICHAICVLLKTKLSDGTLLVEGKTWCGFANSEEDFADNFVGQTIQPFRIEDEARKIPNTNFYVNSSFKSNAVRDGNLITGQQQYSGTAAARLVIEALGV
jgi:putative intracellular protease/amidase